MGVKFVFGDITTLQVDAVVNVINHELADGGRVNRTVHAAAGPELDLYRDQLDHCLTGGALMTLGYHLPARYIIHTVVPRWCDGAEHETAWLTACYQRSLALAVQYNCKSVAIPVCSEDSNDFPSGTALQIVYDTCRYYLAEKKLALDIYLVLYGSSLYNNGLDETAVSSFSSVAEYVQAQYQLEEKTKVDQQIAKSAEPYDPEDEWSQVRHLTLPNGATLLVIAKEAKGSVHFSISSVPKRPENIPDRKDLIPEAPFTRKLLHYMDAKGMAAPVVYTSAGYDRKLFSKIQSDPEYHPRKYTVVRFALALQLDREETDDLLNAAGYALSRSMITDLVVDYCISHDLRSVWEVNNILKSWGLDPI